ncbi:MAG: beta-lactamase family protein [Oscillospiraceae bacterium]|jgi:CubicO group peptidase (beta-lactamase class C family)|nr:beta-lactamase family protein [Oscillospiraceae bacterium]
MTNYSHLNELLQGFTKGIGPAGCACAFAKDGNTLYEGYFGKADLALGRPIDGRSVYRIFSMTKIIVCAAAMMLFERGKFLLSDPIYEYFPEYKHHGSMLVKHAFTMAVGLSNPNEDSPTGRAMRQVYDRIEKDGKPELRTYIKAMADVPLGYEPGARFTYGFGHEMVAGLIEVVSGKSVGQFLREEIFAPLGMEDTGYRFFGDIKQRMVTPYRRAGDGTLTEIPGDADDLHKPDARLERGGSGLFSTVRDYLAFTQMLAGGGIYGRERIMGRKTIDLMRRNQLSAAQMRDFETPYNRGYGYGLGVRTMLDPAAALSPSALGEFGWSGMYGTWTAIDPGEGFSAVYMHQLVPPMQEYCHHRVRAAVFGCL